MESASARKNQTVLVVDGDCQVLKSLLLLLRAYEYNVVAADNAEATLYKLRNMNVNAELFFEKTYILRVGGERFMLVRPEK